MGQSKEIKVLAESRLIVGLGNPGKDYEYTRHNLGFLVVSHIAGRHQLKIRQSSVCKGLTAEGQIFQQRYCLLWPGTFMNNSGVAVKRMMDHSNTGLGDILVVCDCMNLDFGQLRLRRRGSDSGHNGLSSVIYHLASQDFARLRIGIGSPKNTGTKVDFVLEKFNQREKKQLDDIIAEAADCCTAWLTEPMEKTMSRFNKRPDNE